MKTKSIKVNFIMNAILAGLTFLFPLITFPYISRILLPTGVGKVNFATSVVSYFSMVSMLGIPTYGIRACARVRDDRAELSRTVQEILIINAAVTIFVYVGYFWAIQNISRFSQEQELFYVMGSTLIFKVLGVEWLYKGLEKYTYITVRSLCFNIAAIILMFCMVKSQKDYIIYGGISIFAAVGSNVLNFWNLRKHIDIRPQKAYDFKRHLKPITVFFMMTVATSIYTNLDTVMLGFMKNETEMGYYAAAVKIKTILVSFVTALGSVLLPRLSYYLEHGQKEKFIEICQKALSFVLLVSIPLTIYFIVFAEEAILLFSGKEFYGAILPMQIIMPTLILIGITNVLGFQILVPLGKELMVVYSVLAGAVTDLIMNFLCIPAFASAGAAVGTLVAEMVVLFVQSIFLWKYRKYMRYGKELWKIVAGTWAAIVISVCIKETQIAVFLKLMYSAIMFGAIYVCILLITRESSIFSVYIWIKQKLIRNTR